MIYTDSRYADGLILRAQDARSNTYRDTVYRKFPTARKAFNYYTWVESDKIDTVAWEFLGSPAAWWKIMDANPEIADPFNIPVGTLIRIPRG